MVTDQPWEVLQRRVQALRERGISSEMVVANTTSFSLAETMTSVLHCARREQVLQQRGVRVIVVEGDALARLHGRGVGKELAEKWADLIDSKIHSVTHLVLL